MKLLSRALALTLVLALPSSASEVGGYPNASALSGTERLLADQGSPGVTVNITPAQIQSYIFTSGVLPINLGGTGAGIASLALTNLLPSQTGLAGECLATTGTFAQWINCAGAVGANPTSTVGLTANNGSSANFMRADASPPLNQAISPTMTGNWTFNPTGGYILAGTSPAGGSKLFNFGATGGARLYGYSDAGGSGITESDPYTASSLLYLQGTSMSMYTSGVQRLLVGPNGNVSIAAPSSGYSLQVNGLPNTYDAYFAASATTGQSFGPVIVAGTNAADAALTVVNQADSLDLFLVYGNGGVLLGNPAGGNEGPGTINMQGCFINGVACSTASGGPAAAGTLTGTVLASNVVTSSLTSVGTLSTVAATQAGVTNCLTVGSPTGSCLGSSGTLNVQTEIALQGNAIYAGIPQNAQSGAYTLLLSDANKHVYKPTGSSAVTIPANSSVPFIIGTAVTIVNDGTGAMSININTDTMVLSPGGSTGTRTLAVFGEATLLKVTATRWYISGTGLT